MARLVSSDPKERDGSRHGSWFATARASWGDRKTGDRLQAGVAVVTGIALTFGWFASRALANSVSDDSSVSLGVWVTGFTVYTAAAVVGAGFGFLFGLPRPQEESPSGNGPGSAVSSKPYYLPNSNLVKVSDWVTTIVVGLTLVNLRSIQPGLTQMADVLSEPLGNADHSGIVGVAFVLIGVLVGFVSCYLWTTVQVRTLLIRAEEEREKAKVRVQRYEEQVQAEPHDGGV